MKKILLAFTVLVLASCGTAKYYGGFTAEQGKNDMVMLGPVSEQYFLDDNKKMVYVDSLSISSENLIFEQIDMSGVPFTSMIPLDDLQREHLVKFVDFLLTQDAKKRGSTRVPEDLLQLVRTSGNRYGLLVFSVGMTRDNKGIVADVVKGTLLGVATAVLTLGMFTMYTVPEMPYSNIYVAIVDSETGTVAYYNQNLGEECDPHDPAVIHKQVNKLFKDYLK